MSVARISAAVILLGSATARRVDRRDKLVIQRLGLVAPATALRAGRIGAVTTEQDPDMHFVGVALEPAEKSANAVPAAVIVIIIVVGSIPAPFSFDDEVLVRLR